MIDKDKQNIKKLPTIDLKTVLDSRATFGWKIVTIEEVDKYID